MALHIFVEALTQALILATVLTFIGMSNGTHPLTRVALTLNVYLSFVICFLYQYFLSEPIEDTAALGVNIFPVLIAALLTQHQIFPNPVYRFHSKKK